MFSNSYIDWKGSILETSLMKYCRRKEVRSRFPLYFLIFQRSSEEIILISCLRKIFLNYLVWCVMPSLFLDFLINYIVHFLVWWLLRLVSCLLSHLLICTIICKVREAWQKKYCLSRKNILVFTNFQGRHYMYFMSLVQDILRCLADVTCIHRSGFARPTNYSLVDKSAAVWGAQSGIWWGPLRTVMDTPPLTISSSLCRKLVNTSSAPAAIGPYNQATTSHHCTVG